MAARPNTQLAWGETKSLRGVCEIGLVLRVCLPVRQFNIDIAGGQNAVFERKVDTVEIGRFGQRAKSVKTLAALIIEIHPRSRGLRVLAAGRQTWRGRKKICRVLVLVKDIVLVTNEGLPVTLEELGARKVQNGVRQYRRRRRTARYGKATSDNSQKK